MGLKQSQIVKITLASTNNGKNSLDNNFLLTLPNMTLANDLTANDINTMHKQNDEQILQSQTYCLHL